MGTRDPYAIIATIDYPDYAAIRELLLQHDIESVIKPAYEDENGDPYGPMVDLYVHYFSVSKATQLLVHNRLMPGNEPMFTVKATEHVVKAMPFLNTTWGTYLVYVLITLLFIILFVLMAWQGI